MSSPRADAPERSHREPEVEVELICLACGNVQSSLCFDGERPPCECCGSEQTARCGR